MRAILISLLVLAVVSCASAQKQTSANAIVSTGSYEEVFDSVLRVVRDAGLVVLEIDKENGFILAEGTSVRSLTWEDPTINIFLSKKDTGVEISITSTVHGQIYDYGTSKNTIESFCASLEKTYPKAMCSIL